MKQLPPDYQAAVFDYRFDYRFTGQNRSKTPKTGLFRIEL